MNKWKSNYYLYGKLTDFMIDNKIKYGCNVRTICRKNDWKLIPYPAKGYLEYIDISQDGFSVYKDNEFYIFYNSFQNKNRINFTIAHEVGHIVLYHHILTNKSVLAKGKHSLAEQQANVFAQNVLMPISITKEQMELKDVSELAEQFDVSQSMVRMRLSKLKNDFYWFNKIFENRK